MSDKIYLFFIINYFAQGMGGIVYEPLAYLLKDGLGLSAGESAVFVWWMTFPFLVKPLFGILTDMFPIAGNRRRPHIMIVSAMAAASWLILALTKDFSYGKLLTLLILTNMGLAASDVICDAVMVEQGGISGKTGAYQAAQIAALYFTLVVTGLGGGWLVTRFPISRVFALTAIFPALIFFSARWAREGEAANAASSAFQSFKSFLSEKRFWALSLFIFLWSFYPVLGTAQFYYQSDVLKLSPLFIGFLGTLSGVAGVMGAICYGKTAGRVWDVAAWVRGAVLIGVPLSLLYFFYFGPFSVAVVTFVTGLGGAAFRLALMDLAARSCPAGAQATAFAAYMAVFNLAASASNAAGGKLYDFLQAAFSMAPYGAYMTLAVLTLIGGACTLSCWWLVPAVLQGAHKRAGCRL